MSEKSTDSKKVNVTHLRAAKPCPICKKQSLQAFHPFCSLRCADVDLNRWLSGAYVLPVADEELSEEDQQTLLSN